MLGLAGCGGGGGGVASSTPPPPPLAVVGANSGTLTDAPIQGVAYSTSSGVTGTTDANGRYAYNAGDTVTFKLGSLTLGAVPATGIISPIQLAAGDATKLQNILVLVQSLDSDGNPSNGITISAASAAAVTSSVNLSQASMAFASTANTGLTTAMAAGGITAAIRSTASANAHFIAEGYKLFSGNVFGIANANTAFFVRLSANGEYIMGEAIPDNYVSGITGQVSTTLISKAGVEGGTYSIASFSTAGYKIVGAPQYDTNLQSGLSNPASCETGLLPVGDGFVNNGTCFDSGGKIPAITNIPMGLVGAWAAGSATTIKTAHFIFYPNGKYLKVEPKGDGSACSKPGVEFGSYTYIGGVLKIVTPLQFDTDGCAGFSNGLALQAAGAPVTMSADGSTFVVGDSGPLYRISK